MKRLLVALTALALVGGAVLVCAGAWRLLSPEPEWTGAERRAVAPTEIEAAPAARPVSVDVPAIGFTAAVAAMSTDSATEAAGGGQSVLDPPTAEDVYWLEDYGMPGTGSDNTVYLIGHTSTDGRAVFDPLVNRAEQRTTVMPGDEVVVTTEKGRVLYEVVSTERHERSSLADLEGVWTSTPGRLVLITCFFAADSDVASDNMVLFARQAEPGEARR